MKAGAEGVEIILSGKLSGSRGRTEKFKKGYIKHCGETADLFVKEGQTDVFLKAGAVGIRVKIAPPSETFFNRLQFKNPEVQVAPVSEEKPVADKIEEVEKPVADKIEEVDAAPESVEEVKEETIEEKDEKSVEKVEKKEKKPKTEKKEEKTEKKKEKSEEKSESKEKSTEVESESKEESKEANEVEKS